MNDKIFLERTRAGKMSRNEADDSFEIEYKDSADSGVHWNEISQLYIITFNDKYALVFLPSVPTNKSL